MNTQNGGEKGFTLVEIIMALAVGVIVIAAIGTAVVSGQRSSVGIEQKVTTNQDTRTALEFMATEIRMASCNPNVWPDISMWRNPSNCNLTANFINRGIQ
jgi:type IV pilus assembly protein PilW